MRFFTRVEELWTRRMFYYLVKILRQKCFFPHPKMAWVCTAGETLKIQKSMKSSNGFLFLPPSLCWSLVSASRREKNGQHERIHGFLSNMGILPPLIGYNLFVYQRIWWFEVCGLTQPLGENSWITAFTIAVSGWSENYWPSGPIARGWAQTGAWLMTQNGPLEMCFAW